MQLAALMIYQLMQPGEADAREWTQRLARLGGWSGRPKAPIGPTVLMRGALIFLAAVQLCQQLGPSELLSMARSLEPLLGPILRREGEL